MNSCNLVNQVTPKHMIRKTHRSLKWLSTAMCSLALAGSASLCVGQGVNDYVVNQFTNGTGSWAYNYGNTPATTIVWDSAENSGPGASPGAMKVTIPFNLCTGNNQSDFESNPLPDVLDLTTYSKLHFSVKVDPSSSRLSDWGGGAFGNMRFHVRPANWSSDVNIGSDNATSQQWIGSDAYGVWKDYAVNIDHTTGIPTKSIAGILGIDIWSGWGSCAAPIGHTNTVIFWMDNIWYEKVVGPPPPPPTVDITKAGTAGIQVGMDDNGNQWQRDAIASPATEAACLWAGNGATPVTYSFTIADFPDPVVHEGFEAHMYLVNENTSGGNQTYGGCDWNVPDIAILSIWSVTNNGGSYLCEFQFKTNLPNANPPENPIHRPAQFTNSTVLGTWSVTFTYNTNVTISAPGGYSTNFTIPEDAVLNNFSPATSFIQFGFHKNDNENNGHNNGVSGTFSNVKKTGGGFEFDDSFGGAAFDSNYGWRKTSASAVNFVPVGTAWFLNWTLPAIGFYPQSAASITGPWTDITTAISQSGGKAHVTVPVGGNTGFFRTINRPFTKLQVLLPGETAAPNTVSGKTGTPIAQSTGVPFNITVRSVDSVWNLVGSSDVISISSTDAAATDGASVALPVTTTLAGGSATFTVIMGTGGSQTITATDVTDGAKTPSTSTPLAL